MKFVVILVFALYSRDTVSLNLLNLSLVFFNEVFHQLVQISIYVVVVNDVHEIERVMHSFKKLETFWLWLVDRSPSKPAAECLIFPDHERGEVNDCWLDDLLVSEDTPGYCVDRITLYVSNHVSMNVSCLVSDHLVALKERCEQV